MSVEQDLAQFSEAETGEAFALQNSKLLKVELSEVTIQAKLGGYLSPNRNVDPKAYPNAVQQEMAKALIAAGDDFRFDMSDQAPQAFGGTPGKGEWKALQDFLKNPKDIAGTQRRLEADAAAAYGN